MVPLLVDFCMISCIWVLTVRMVPLLMDFCIWVLTVRMVPLLVDFCMTSCIWVLTVRMVPLLVDFWIWVLTVSVVPPLVDLCALISLLSTPFYFIVQQALGGQLLWVASAAVSLVPYGRTLLASAIMSTIQCTRQFYYCEAAKPELKHTVIIVCHADVTSGIFPCWNKTIYVWQWQTAYT